MKGLLIIILLIADCYANSNQIIFALIGHSQMTRFVSSGGKEAFFKSMVELYPKYSFKSIELIGEGWKSSHFDYGVRKAYPSFIDEIKRASDTCIIGGLIVMLGITDAETSEDAERVSENIIKIALDVRNSIGNYNLPVFIGRYEKNCKLNDGGKFKKYGVIVDFQLNSIPIILNNSYLFPIKHINKKWFEDSHHYDSTGSKICGEQLSTIIQINNEDFWYDE